MLEKIFLFFILLFSSNTPIVIPDTVNTVKNVPVAIPISISIQPENIIQGDPIMISVNSTSSQKIYFNQKEIPSFIYNDKTIAFVGTDINQKTGEYLVEAKENEKVIASSTINLNKRPKKEAPLGIPEKLGGNTKASQQVLVNTLAQEAAVLNNLVSTTTLLWSEPFTYPVENPTITDEYGYSRQTGDFEIAHKGVDFRAGIGTEVFAMNDGKVILAEEFRNYGNIIAIDHGLGLITLYLHLSEFKVKKGDMVKQNQNIGLSGMTGYAEGAHLHVSIRINSKSIDPVTFLNFFK